MGRDVWALDVFRRAYALSLDVHRASQGFPKSEQYGGVADQLRRASKSVCALLAEGSGRQIGSDVEFRRYVIMALGSVEEAKLWCVYARDLGFADAAGAGAWQSSYEEVARMLQGLLKHLKKGLESSSPKSED
jgi:four helix bundle protein